MSQKAITVGFPFSGDDIGGSHISALNLISSFDRDRINPIVFVHHPRKALSRYLDENKIDYVTIEDIDILSPQRDRPFATQSFSALRYPVSMVKIIKLLRRHKIDIVHTNDGAIHTTWALPTYLAGAKLLWHHRGDPRARAVNMLAPLLAKHVVTVSRFAQPAKPLLPLEGRISVLHSPFRHPDQVPDREESRLALVRELGLPEETRFVGYFGLLNERKRPLRFVEAVHAFHRSNPDFPIAGLLFGAPEQAGPRLDLETAERARALGIADKIHLMGFRHPVAPYMCAVDILLVPAMSEPFGRTLIEAMMYGTPVVATNHGGNPEAIENDVTGFLVEPENPEAFVAPMERLLKDRNEWQRISETARTSTLAAYGIKPHVDGIVSIYQRILGRRPSDISARTAH
ncbi:glycosyltransferase family 4 protein [Ensifer adhaerens]|uniref:glycosyltransferase family 4 protein n=1 Tax=Ensifer adhaerens TaxID=106592 RepID=UPI003999FE2C